MEQVGSYAVVSELGRGGMGVVYVACDTRLDRFVAIKALLEQLAGDPERVARIEREEKLVASLNHPGIAAVYALELHADKNLLLMEYSEGETLAARLKRGRSRSTRRYQVLQPIELAVLGRVRFQSAGRAVQSVDSRH